MIDRFSRWLLRSGDADHVSRSWLRAQAQRETRIEFWGVNIAFPIQKRRNEMAWWNRQTARRRA